MPELNMQVEKKERWWILENPVTKEKETTCGRMEIKHSICALLDSMQTATSIWQMGYRQLDIIKG